MEKISTKNNLVRLIYNDMPLREEMALRNELVGNDDLAYELVDRMAIVQRTDAGGLIVEDQSLLLLLMSRHRDIDRRLMRACLAGHVG